MIIEVKDGVHQESVLSPLLLAMVVDVIIENARRAVVNELLYADNLVLMSETIKDLNRRFFNWKGAAECKGLRVNTGKTKVIVSESKRELFKCKIDPCGVCGRRAMANSVLCTKCENWVRGRCAKIKRINAQLATFFVCSRCRGIIVDFIEKLCDEVETVNGFYHLGDRLNSSGL